MNESNFNQKVLPDGVDHGPYVPTEDPYEQTNQHRAAVGAAHYEIGDVAHDELSRGLDEQKQSVTAAISSRDYDALGTLAGPAMAEEQAKTYGPGDLQREESELLEKI